MSKVVSELELGFLNSGSKYVTAKLHNYNIYGVINCGEQSIIFPSLCLELHSTLISVILMRPLGFQGL